MIEARRFSQLTRWASMSGQIVGLQMVVQALNATTGLFLIHYLSKEDYAWFTIFASLMATLSLLGDGGVNSGVTSIGGKIHSEQGPFARLIIDALRVSVYMTLFGIILVSPFFYAIFTKVSATPTTAIFAILLASAAAYPATYSLILTTANKLHSRIQFIQITEVTGALSRMVLTLTALAIGWKTVVPIVTATVLSTLLQAGIIRSRSKQYFKDAKLDASYLPQLKTFVLSLYANHLFYSIQGQISTWIIGWFGGSTQVAELGALGRLGMLMVAVIAPISYLAMPSIARIQDIGILRKRIASVAVLGLFLASIPALFGYLVPQPFLWILGSQYGHLTSELPLALGAQGVTLLASMAWGIVLTRGWVRHAWMTILTTILGIAMGAMVCPLNTLSGVLLFNTISVTPTLVFCSSIITSKLVKKG